MLLSSLVSNPVPDIIIDFAVILLAGLIFGRIAEKFKIPSVTGYLVAGLIIGPILGLINYETLQSYHIVSDIALGFIAFQVGNELWLGKLRKTGIKIVVITIIQALTTTLLVILLLLAIGTSLPVALVLGAVAAATAPAPIMMIVKKYRTKGELTDTIIPVVGLDDAVGVIIFGILLSISVSLLGNSEEVISFIEIVGEPVIEIGISILIGTFVGIATGFALKTIKVDRDRDEKNLIVIVIAVFITTGLALYFHASPILTPMISGAIVTNMINKECYRTEEHTIVTFIPPLMIMFFVIAGAELQFNVLTQVGLVGVIYVIGRTIGKWTGSYLGCVVTKTGNDVKKYLGLSLLPQSGVAIGLSIAAYIAMAEVAPDEALIVKNVVLASVLVFGLIGPYLVKVAFQKSNEIRIED